MTQLIKIVRTLYKYFLPRSKKMTLSSKVIKLRDELLKNCNYAIDRLEAAEKRVASYSSNNQEEATTGTFSTNEPTENTTSGTSGTRKSESGISYEVTDYEIKNSFMILTHGVLIQEWEHFLYDIFVEGVIYYLKGFNLGDSTYKLSLSNLKPSIELAEMREKLSAEFRSSLKGYKELFSQTHKLFNVEEPILLEEMRKQTQIRHIFQHNKV